MAHKLEQEFCLSIKERFKHYFQDKIVLDIGSGDVNGNNRYLFDRGIVIGIDIGPGPNVDIIGGAENLSFRDEFFDTIISTECFEHNPSYAETIRNAIRMLKSNGLFLFTCATTGRPEHGTSKYKPNQSFALKVGIDYYKNLTEEDIREAIDIDKSFSSYEFSTKAQDLYFWGIKK
jgi:SAM-dependent methyltransferase